MFTLLLGQSLWLILHLVLQFSVTEHFREAVGLPRPPPGVYFFYEFSPIQVRKWPSPFFLCCRSWSFSNTMAGTYHVKTYRSWKSANCRSGPSDHVPMVIICCEPLPGHLTIKCPQPEVTICSKVPHPCSTWKISLPGTAQSSCTWTSWVFPVRVDLLVVAKIWAVLDDLFFSLCFTKLTKPSFSVRDKVTSQVRVCKHFS